MLTSFRCSFNYSSQDCWGRREKHYNLKYQILKLKDMTVNHFSQTIWIMIMLIKNYFFIVTCFILSIFIQICWIFPPNYLSDFKFLFNKIISHGSLDTSECHRYIQCILLLQKTFRYPEYLHLQHTYSKATIKKVTINC